MDCTWQRKRTIATWETIIKINREDKVAIRIFLQPLEPQFCDTNSKRRNIDWNEFVIMERDLKAHINLNGKLSNNIIKANQCWIRTLWDWICVVFVWVCHFFYVDDVVFYLFFLIELSRVFIVSFFHGNGNLFWFFIFDQSHWFFHVHLLFLVYMVSVLKVLSRAMWLFFGRIAFVTS